MSRALKRKHVLREMWEDDFALPKGDQQIVKVRGGKGNNLHEVQTAEGDVFLVSMPTKFRRVVWVKKGQYVIIDPVKEGHKVKGEINKILTRDHIKIYHENNVWPSAFEDAAVKDPNAYPPTYKGIKLEELKSDDEKDGSNEDSEFEKSDSEVESDESGDCENDSDDNSQDSDSDDNNKDGDSENVDTCVHVNNCSDKNEKSESKS